MILKSISSRFSWKQELSPDWVVSDYCERIERAYYNLSNELASKKMGVWIKPLINPSFWKEEMLNRTNNSIHGFPPDWDTRKQVINYIDNGSCRRCGVTAADADRQTHHLTSRSAGGNHEFENLALLCRDCHTFMPSRGHLEIRGYGLFMVSNNRKVHTAECRYSNDCQKKMANLMTLKGLKYKLCKICNPMLQHQENVDLWRPKIMDDIDSLKVQMIHELSNSLGNHLAS